MAFGIDDFVTGSFSVGNGLINNWFAGERQKDAQAFNSAEADTMRKWQESMSNSAYQRGMRDMKAAGLNPILAYQKGPASSPTGAMASTTPAPVHDVGLGTAATTAMAHARWKLELENLAQDNLIKREQVLNTAANTYRSMAETRVKSAEEPIIKEKLQGAIAEAMEAKIRQGYLGSTAGHWLNMFGHGAGDVAKIGALLPKVNINSGKSVSQKDGFIGDTPHSSYNQNFDTRFNAAFGR